MATALVIPRLTMRLTVAIIFWICAYVFRFTFSPFMLPHKTFMIDQMTVLILIIAKYLTAIYLKFNLFSNKRHSKVLYAKFCTIYRLRLLMFGALW